MDDEKDKAVATVTAYAAVINTVEIRGWNKAIAAAAEVAEEYSDAVIRDAILRLLIKS